MIYYIYYLTKQLTTMNNNNGVNPNVVMAFIIGAAAGVAAGLLMAPQKGSQTRDKLVGALKDIDLSLDKLGINDLKDKITSKAREYSNQAKEYTNQARNTVADAKQSID